MIKQIDLSDGHHSREVAICANLDEVSQQAARTFAALANEAVEQRGRFTVCLSGGSTPRQTYALLADEPFRKIPWAGVHIFWGDERVVPLAQPDNHFCMATDILFSKIAIPRENIHRMRVESGTPVDAAEEYEAQLSSFFELQPGGLPRCDLIILGMGADGHMASLFPGTTALAETGRLVAANYVPKLEAYRLTLTFPVLNNARQIMFLVSGVNKADALYQVLHDGPQSGLPASLLAPQAGKLYWVVDQDAASKIQTSVISEVSAQ